MRGGERHRSNTHLISHNETFARHRKGAESAKNFLKKVGFPLHPSRLCGAVGERLIMNSKRYKE